ncbi:MAG: nucleoside kinase [Defluviitaleaceae bacterium]|nr:nucleoside kinase [Defluviitaleaceae bacterium]
MSEHISLNIENAGPGSFPSGISLLELARENSAGRAYQILAAEVDGEVMELRERLHRDASVRFLDITDGNGFRIYQRSATFLMVYAVQEVLGKGTRVSVEYSISKNYICEIHGLTEPLTDEMVGRIEERMRRAVREDMPISTVSVPVDEAIRIAAELNQFDKVNILKYRGSSNAKLYKVDWYHDYFYGPMAASMGCVYSFKLHRTTVEDGFILQFPESSSPDTLKPLKEFAKISEVFAESSKWARILGVDTVGALNDQICKVGIENIIRISEALHEKKVANIADMITKHIRRIVLIAGPSSSGKTTLANRLRIQLKVNGLRTHIISLDDYYRNREDIELEPDGSLNLEKIEAIDVAQINEDLSRLLRGEEVEIPHFNFRTGKREYKGRKIAISRDDVIVMEGIHGLNEKLTAQIAHDTKFKIFISALTQLNIDYHNRIPTTDTRLIRRLVRDFKHRGATVERTFEMWPSVMQGEADYIFPFQEEADAFFNSALVYEMCILKPYVTPLLLAVDKSQPEYGEARRLLRFLDSFMAQSSEQVPPNSILREFIGGGWFS